MSQAKKAFRAVVVKEPFKTAEKPLKRNNNNPLSFSNDRNILKLIYFDRRYLRERSRRWIFDTA